MKTISILLVPIFILLVSCSEEPPKAYDHGYQIKWFTAFEDNLLTVTNLKTKDTVFRQTSAGIYQFYLERGYTYHVNIRQNKLETDRKYTEIELKDLESGEVLGTTLSSDCLREWGYYLKVK